MSEDGAEGHGRVAAMRWALACLAVAAGCGRRPPAAVVPGPYQPYRAEAMHAGDALVFYGWSSDGRRFAYQTYSPGGGLPECKETLAVFVIDADADRPVTDGVLAIQRSGEDDDGNCARSGEAGLAGRREELLRRFGIHETAFAPPGTFESDDLVSWTIDGAGVGATARFATAHAHEPALAEDPSLLGASYRLELRVDGRDPVTVEQPRAAGVDSYDPSGALLFVHGDRAAVFVPQVNHAHHGTWISWNVHGLALR